MGEEIGSDQSERASLLAYPNPHPPSLPNDGPARQFHHPPAQVSSLPVPWRLSFPPRRRDSGVLGLDLGRAAPARGISAGVGGRMPLPGVGSRGRSCTAPGVESDSLVVACCLGLTPRN